MITSLSAHRNYPRLLTAQISALFGTGSTTVAPGLLGYQPAGDTGRRSGSFDTGGFDF